MLVVEKYLDVISGHETTQVSAIQTLAGGRALTVVTGRHCAVPDDEAARVLAVLSTRKEIKTAPEQAHDHDLRAMRQILSSDRMKDHGAILYPTAQTHDLRVALRMQSAGPIPQTLYMRVLLDREIAGLTDDERAALKSLVEAERIVLLTETDTLAAHFMTQYALRSHETALCLPCSFFPSNAPAHSPSPPRSPAQRYRVGVLGGWRAEKGVEMLPQITWHLRQALAGASQGLRAELAIQKPPMRRKFKQKLKQIRPILARNYAFHRAAGWPGFNTPLSVIFMPANLSKDTFTQTFMSMDLLLVPYRLEEYRHRGSGIILDAVAARKPIVYTRGMGMSEYLTHGNAEAAEEAPADYAEKVVAVLSDIGRYRAAAELAAMEFDRRLAAAGSFLRAI